MLPVLLALGLGALSPEAVPTTTPTQAFRQYEHDLALALAQYQASTLSDKSAARVAEARGRIAADIPGLVTRLTSGELSEEETAITKRTLEAALETVFKGFGLGPQPPATQAPNPAGVGDAAMREAVNALAVCGDKTKKVECLAARNTLLAAIRAATTSLDAEPLVDLPCSPTLRGSRSDPTDSKTTRFEKIKNVKSYLSELRTVIDESDGLKHLECAPDPAVPAGIEREKLRRLADEALRAVDMRPRVAAILQPSLVYDKDQRVVSSGAMVRFESAAWSREYGSRLGTPRFHGAFGLSPSLVATKKTPVPSALTQTNTITTQPSGSTTTVTQSGTLIYPCAFTGAPTCAPNPDKKPTFETSLQNALVAHLGLSTGIGIGRGGRVGEVNGFVRAGVTHVGADVIVTKEAAGQSTAGAIQLDDPMKDGAFFEWGVRAALFQNDDTEAPTIGLLRPMVGLEAGRRRDHRFGSLTNLTDEGVGATREDRERWFVRLTLTRLPVFSDKGKVFDLSLKLDHEWAFKNSGRIPAVTRIFIQGNLDFMKALRGAN